MARELGLAVRTVQRLFQRFERLGQDGIATRYDRCGRKQPRRAAADVLAQVAQLREQHPTWGAPLIRVWLARQPDPGRLPSPRTLQR